MKRLLILLVLITSYGCAHTISRELRERADRGINTEALFKDPDAYKGKLVILGGHIISARNTNEGTYLEVLERPLDSLERPVFTDKSSGRFIVLYEGYLDTVLYGQGREITVAGEVAGKMVLPLGEIKYSYTLVKSRELHLIEPRRRIPITFGIGVFHSF